MSSGQRRLTHSEAAFLKSMQMSRATLFVFCEGIKDRFIHDGVCRAALGAAGRYEIRSGDELPGSGGGKQRLLGFYNFLKRRRALNARFMGKRTASLFSLDKDVDDIEGTKVRSPHVSYTRGYCVENELFRCGNLARALASATSLDEASVLAAIPEGSNDAWCRQAALHWEDWITLCVVERLSDRRAATNFRVRSSIHPNDPYQPADPSRQAIANAQIKSAVGSNATHKALLTKARTIVRDAFTSSGDFHAVFNGKWFIAFMESDARRIASGKPISLSAFPDRLLSCLQLTVEYRGPWFEFLARRVSALH